MKLQRTSLVCRDAVELVSDYLDGSLGGRDRRRFERHLAECTACTAYLEQMRTTVALTGRVQPDSLPDDVVDGLVDVFRQYRSDL